MGCEAQLAGVQTRKGKRPGNCLVGMFEGNCLAVKNAEGNCLGWKCPGKNCPVVEFFGRGIVPGEMGKCSGEINEG